jgi:hypothetical protein
MIAILALLRPLLPLLWRAGLAVLILAALWLAAQRWRDDAYAEGVHSERQAWEAKNLEQAARNERTRADRAEAALLESRRNEEATRHLGELFEEISRSQAKRVETLQLERSIPDDRLFTAGPEKCSVYITPEFVERANAR